MDTMTFEEFRNSSLSFLNEIALVLREATPENKEAEINQVLERWDMVEEMKHIIF